MRTMPIQTNRGTLTDRNGEVLALSIPSRTIIADPKVILAAHPDFNDGKWRYLAEALKMPLADLEHTIAQDPSRHYVALGRKIESGIAQDIMKLHLKGISSLFDDSHYYPISEAAQPPLIGIVGADNQGLNGIERGFDNLLQCEPGMRQYRQDGDNNEIALVNYTAIRRLNRRPMLR